MMKNIKTDLLIIGAGPAGLTAGLYGARAGKPTLILEGRSPSRLSLGYEIENYPGFRSIHSADLLAKFKDHARHFGAELISGDAVAFGLESDPKYVTTREALIEARAVILATGKPFSQKRMIPGEERLTGQGVSYCAVCDGPLYRGSAVVAYGHSEEAVEDVLTLHQMGCRVHWVSGSKSRKEVEHLREGFTQKGLHLHPGAEIKEIVGDKRVEKVVLETDKSTAELAVSGVFIFRGVAAASIYSRAGLLLDHKSCLKVDRFQKTNLSGVFAAGDVTCGGLQIASAVGEGCVAAVQALAYLRA